MLSKSLNNFILIYRKYKEDADLKQQIEKI